MSVPLVGGGVVFVRCVSCQTAANVTPAKTWSSLGDQGDPNSAVSTDGL